MKELNALTKRDLLAARKFNVDELLPYAEDYFSQERYGEAFEFYRKAGDQDGVQKVKKAAIEIADPELLWRIEHFIPDAISREDWSRCGEKGMTMGKYRIAAFAFNHAADAERKAAAEKEFMAPEPGPSTPESPALAAGPTSR